MRQQLSELVRGRRRFFRIGFLQWRFGRLDVVKLGRERILVRLVERVVVELRLLVERVVVGLRLRVERVVVGLRLLVERVVVRLVERVVVRLRVLLEWVGELVLRFRRRAGRADDLGGGDLVWLVRQ